MKYFYVGATPEVERAAAAAVREWVAAEFGAPVRDLPFPDVGFALDPVRGQYASIPILEMLLQLCPEDALKVLAVTERDLFIPVLTFVFGHAQLSGRAAVVSFARLRQEFYGLAPNTDVFLHRARKEALHEAGHTFGLVHCAARECAMSLATSVRQIDLKNAAFCASCASLLRKRQRESPL